MDKAIDPLTGEEFIKKRRNQKFANKANQIKYNNQKALAFRDKKRVIDKLLTKNHKIMFELVGDEVYKTVSRDFLLGAGFNFDVLTFSQEIEGEIFFCTYDYGYLNKENEEVLIANLNHFSNDPN